MLEHGRQQAATEVAGRKRHFPAAVSGGSEVETIPLCELRSSDWSTASKLGGGGAAASTAADALRQLHAQSSAETSGVGDSLQRMHALSSTETSGYGGDPLQSPTDLASITSPSDQPRVPATTSVRSALPEYRTTVSAAPSSGVRRPVADGGMSGAAQHYTYNGIASPTPALPSSRLRYSSPTTGRRGEATGYRPAAAVERYDDDEQFYLDDDDRSTTSRGRYSRSRARRSNGVRGDGAGSGSEEGEFLGRNTQSAWLRWSHERRASYRRKVEYMEKRQSDMERFRVSSPVRKARQESARLRCNSLLIDIGIGV